MIGRNLALAALLISCVMPISSVHAQADASAPKASDWVLNVNDEPIGRVLQQVAQLQGYRCVIDGELTGKISGQFRPRDLEAFLNNLSNLYDFVWFLDGHTLVVSPDSMVETRVFGSDRFEVQKLYAILEKLGLLNTTIYHRLLVEENILIIAAPPTFLEVVENLGDALGSSESVPLAEQETIRIFPLNYAWAYDLDFNYSGSSISVPGVATLLNEIMTGQKQGTGASSSNQAGAPLAMESIGGDKVTPQDFGAKSPEDSATATKADNLERILSITADVRRNAVIVRDRKSRIPLYEELIEDFDQPVKIISISAVIVDLSSQAKLNLGLDEFSATNGTDSFGISPARNLLNTASSFNASAMVVAGGWELATKIQAQEDNGNARIVSQPAVLTFNNMGAVIARDSSFYIKVPGTYNSQLFEVTTGLTLRVTPQILEENGTTKIKLLITVKDGTIQEQDNSVDGIPLTTENFINTQAIIDEGQSLLIGGIYSTTRTVADSGIPWLKDIPILGYVFKTETTVNAQTERLYLITPQIMTVDANAAEVDPYRELLNRPEPNQVLTSPTLFHQEENFLTQPALKPMKPVPPLTTPEESVEENTPLIVPISNTGEEPSENENYYNPRSRN